MEIKNSKIYTPDKTGMSSTMGYSIESDKQYATTHSGSLKNNFDKEKVQNEIDLQVKVTKEFRSNVQHFQVEQNKRKDDLKAQLERNEITQQYYNEQVAIIERQNLMVNMIAGGLMSPSDSILGIATSTIAPAVSFRVGQHFKNVAEENKRQGITEEAELTTSQELAHIATHAIIGAITAQTNGSNALGGALSAGGAEALAPIVAKVLYGKDNSQNLTADEKEIVVAVTTAIGTLSGSVIGDSSANAYIGNTVAGNAVANNWLTYDEDLLQKKLTKRAEAIRTKYVWNLDDLENPELVSEPTDAEKAELAQIEKQLTELNQVSNRRDKEYRLAKSQCDNRISCDMLIDIGVIDRKKMTEKGYEIYEQDLKNGTVDKNWVVLPNAQSIYHNLYPNGQGIDESFPNTKLVDRATGKLEVVLNSNGEIIKDDTNAGTFNFYPPSDMRHIEFDVDPYIDYGNGGNDKSTYESRRRTSFIWSKNDSWWGNTKSTVSTILSPLGGNLSNKTKNQRKKRDEAIKMFNEANKRKTGEK